MFLCVMSINFTFFWRFVDRNLELFRLCCIFISSFYWNWLKLSSALSAVNANKIHHGLNIIQFYVLRKIMKINKQVLGSCRLVCEVLTKSMFKAVNCYTIRHSFVLLKEFNKHISDVSVRNEIKRTKKLFFLPFFSVAFQLIIFK